MHPVEVHVPAPVAPTNLQLAEAFEEVDQINGASTLQTSFMGKGLKRRPGPTSVRIDV